MPFHFGTVLAESGRHFFRSLSQGMLLMAYINQLLNLLNSMRQETWDLGWFHLRDEVGNTH